MELNIEAVRFHSERTTQYNKANSKSTWAVCYIYNKKKIVKQLL